MFLLSARKPPGGGQDHFRRDLQTEARISNAPGRSEHERRSSHGAIDKAEPRAVEYQVFASSSLLPNSEGRNGQSTSHTRNSQKTNDRAHARAELPGAFSFSVFGALFERRPAISSRGPRNAPRFGVVTRHSQSSRNAPKRYKTNDRTCVYPERPGARLFSSFVRASARNCEAGAKTKRRRAGSATR